MSESRNKNKISRSERKTVFPLVTSTAEHIIEDDSSKKLLSSKQWRIGNSQEVTSYREYFSIEFKSVIICLKLCNIIMLFIFEET